MRGDAPSPQPPKPNLPDPIAQTQPSRPSLPNPTFQTQLPKPSLPNPTFQTQLPKPSLPNPASQTQTHNQAPCAAEGDKPQYATARTYISKLNPSRDDAPMWFSSCPKCSKKAVEGSSGYNCENCGWQGEECAYRYLLQLVCIDASGSQWLTAFNEQATAILGMPADELKRLRDNHPAEFEAVLTRATWQPMSMVLRSKKESWQGNTRVKMHVQRSAKANFLAEAKMMLANIAKYDSVKAEA